MAISRLELLKKYIYLAALILGVIGLVTAQVADTSRARILFTCISLGPTLMGLVTILRYKLSAGNEKAIAKAITECAWICLSFGLGFWMMLSSTYYAVQPGVAVVLVINALLLVAAGLHTLASIGKMGYALTP